MSANGLNQTLRLGAAGVVAGALAVSAALFSAHAAEFEFRANTVGNKESISYAGLEKLKAVVAARSGGRVKINLFASGALGDQVSGIESMQAGTLDIATVETPITGVDGILGVTALPYIFRDRAHVALVMDGPIGDWIEDRLAAKGLRVLGFMEGGFRQITNNVRPINTPADLKGVKMRTPGSKLRIKIFNHYGANASPLPFTELYTALQTRVFDGQENPIIWVKTTKFYEVQKYLSLTNHLYTVTYLLMSEKSFQKLPFDLQLLLQQAGSEAAAVSVEIGRRADSEIVEFLKGKGMEVNQADVQTFVEASRSIWKDWGNDMGEEAQKLIQLISAAGT